jgi:hypothetical protein
MEIWVIRVTFMSESRDLDRFSALSKRFRCPIDGNNFISQREFRESLADGAACLQQNAGRSAQMCGGSPE